MQTLPKDGKVRKDTCPMHCGWYGCNMRTFLQCSAISLVPTGHQHGSSLNCPFLVYYHIVNQFLKATAIHIKFQPKKVVKREVVWGRRKTMRCVCNRGVFGVSSLALCQLDIICLAARRLKVCAWKARKIGRTWQDTTGHKQTNKTLEGHPLLSAYPLKDARMGFVMEILALKNQSGIFGISDFHSYPTNIKYIDWFS